MTKAKFVAEVHFILDEVEFPSSLLAGHNFRVGAASTVAVAGLEDSTIRTQGRWKSRAYLIYVRMFPGQLALMSVSLATGSF